MRHRETLAHGLENAAGAFIGRLQGRNMGKPLIQLGQDSG
jgi:NADPH-dependent curcumin reductase CurA